MGNRIFTRSVGTVRAGVIGLIIVVLSAAGALAPPTGAQNLNRPPAEARAVSVESHMAPNHNGSSQVRSGSWRTGDRHLFTQLARFFACSRDWFALLAGFLGYGQAPLTTAVTVADTCRPVSGLQALGWWIIDSR